jgi:hypothetical protein
MPCPSHPPWSNYVWWGVQIWSSSLCSFLQSPVISSLFGPNILLSTLFSNTLSLCSSLVRLATCHHSTARPQVADGGDGLQIWRVAANILNTLEKSSTIYKAYSQT